MRGVQGVEEVGRDRNRPVDDFLLSRCVPTFFQGAECDCATRQINPGRCDFPELGWAAPGPVQGLTQGPVPGGLAPGHGKEGRALLGVQIEPVSGRVMEAHLGPSQQRYQIHHRI
jgi:hypothetical protein